MPSTMERMVWRADTPEQRRFCLVAAPESYSSDKEQRPRPKAREASEQPMFLLVVRPSVVLVGYMVSPSVPTSGNTPKYQRVVATSTSCTSSSPMVGAEVSRGKGRERCSPFSPHPPVCSTWGWLPRRGCGGATSTSSL